MLHWPKLAYVVFPSYVVSKHSSDFWQYWNSSYVTSSQTTYVVFPYYVRSMRSSDYALKWHQTVWKFLVCHFFAEVWCNHGPLSKSYTFYFHSTSALCTQVTWRSIFKIFSNVSQTIAFFVQTCEKVTQVSFPFWRNRLKLCIYCNFLMKFFKIFENSPASGGLRPRTPYLADPLKCPPEPKSWRRRWFG